MKQPPRPRIPASPAGAPNAATPPSRARKGPGEEAPRRGHEHGAPRPDSVGRGGRPDIDEDDARPAHGSGTGAASHPDSGSTSRPAGGGRRRPERSLVRHRTPRSLEHPLEASDAAEVLGSHEGAVSTGLVDRLAERRRARLRLRGTHLLVLVSAVATVAVVVWGVFFSPVLALSEDRISVTGADEDLTAQVTHAVDPFVGTPVPRLDTAAVSSAVGRIPLVRSVEVTRSWPDGITLVVHPRVATLAEKDAQGVALVDDEGVAVSHRAEAPSDLPLVVLPPDGKDRARAADAATLTWAALPQDLRGSVDRIRADGQLVTLELDGGRTVNWGTGEDGKLKAKVLQLLLSQRPATVYDVSDPARPVTS